MLEINLDRLFILQQISGTFLYSMEAGSIVEYIKTNKLLWSALNGISSSIYLN
jgi:hypothetical protein